jgi:transposase
MKAYNEANIRWCSRVPETSTEAKAALDQQPENWQAFSDKSGHYVSLELTLPQGKERWLMVRTHKNLEAAQKTMEKKADKDHGVWEKRLKHLSREVFACQSDAAFCLGEGNQEGTSMAPC